MIPEFRDFTIDGENKNIVITQTGKAHIAWRTLYQLFQVIYLLFVYYLFIYREDKQDSLVFYFFVIVFFVVFVRPGSCNDTQIAFQDLKTVSYKRFFIYHALVLKLEDNRKRRVYTTLSDEEIEHLAVLFEEQGIPFKTCRI